jgi:hypothetical protein
VPPEGTGTLTFAVSNYSFGDTDRDGTLDHANGWKQLGFDLDGILSGPSTPGLCMPAAGGPDAVHTDGCNGIDNAFGSEIVRTVFLSLSGAPSGHASDGIAQGDYTVLISVDALGGGTDESSLTARLYTAAGLSHPPVNDGTDAWPVRPESLSNPTNLASAKLETSTAYVVSNTFVAQFHGALPLEISMSGLGILREFHLDIRNPIVVMELDPQRRSATNGTIAGVLDLGALVSEFRQWAGSFDPSLCTGPTIDAILTQIEQAADILIDSTQDPTKTCNGISIGLGFNATRAQLGAIAPPEVIPTPCGPDGGASTGDAGEGG